MKSDPPRISLEENFIAMTFSICTLCSLPLKRAKKNCSARVREISGKEYPVLSQVEQQKYLLLTRLLSCRYGLQIALNACELLKLASVRAELITFQASTRHTSGIAQGGLAAWAMMPSCL